MLSSPSAWPWPLWLGAYEKDGQWRWVSGKRLSTDHPGWYPGQPDGSGDCLGIDLYRNLQENRDQWAMWDAPCHYIEPFLCEYPGTKL